MKTYRKEIGLTQKELAQRLGLSQSEICDYEQGRNIPSSNTLARIAIALHSSTDYLLGLTSDPRPLPVRTAMRQGEEELLKLFFSLSHEKRERAIGILMGMNEG